MNKQHLTNFNLQSKLSARSHQTRGSNTHNLSNFSRQSASVNSSQIRQKVNRLNLHKNIDVSIIKGYPQFKTWLIDINKILDDQFPQQPDESDEVC